MTTPDLRTLSLPVTHHVDGLPVEEAHDSIAIEEPLEIQLRYPNDPPSTLAVVMRTPGDDLDLVAGFLLSERVIESGTDLVELREAGIGRNKANVVVATLHPDRLFDPRGSDRFGITTSACGVCGTTAIDVTGAHTSRLDPLLPPLTKDLIQGLPSAIRSHQPLFEATGATHVAGLMAADGEVLIAREDVGRHFALDKVIGAAIRGQVPTAGTIAITSARASFELAQKSLIAGIPVLVAVGPPTSLAVRLAAEHGLTLIGFASERRMNVYAGRARLQAQDELTT